MRVYACYLYRRPTIIRLFGIILHRIYTKMQTTATSFPSVFRIGFSRQQGDGNCLSLAVYQPVRNEFFFFS